MDVGSSPATATNKNISTSRNVSAFSIYKTIKESGNMRPTSKVIAEIMKNKQYLSCQERKTLMGQANHGDEAATLKGLSTLLKRKLRKKGERVYGCEQDSKT